jgi:hypothetical protein
MIDLTHIAIPIPKPNFEPECTICKCAMGYVALNCRCECHEDLREFARFYDLTLEDAVIKIKKTQKELENDPLRYFLAKLNLELYGDEYLKAMKERLKDK